MSTLRKYLNFTLDERESTCAKSYLMDAAKVGERTGPCSGGQRESSRYSVRKRTPSTVQQACLETRIMY